MTRRMVAAVGQPAHRRPRALHGPDGRGPQDPPESQFDAGEVFAACRDSGVAVEVNSRPERLDPPRRLLTQAVEAGCLLAVDTDAHAPGQLAWMVTGYARAAECGAEPEQIVTTRSVDDLLAWTGRHR